MARPQLAFCASLGLALISATAASAAPDPAAATLQAYSQKTRIPCYRQHRETTCTIASLTGSMDQKPKIFYGKSGAVDVAVAFLSYQYDDTGNAVDQMAIVLTDAGGDADGRWKVLGDGWKVVGRADNTIGSNPRDVQFGGDTISYVGTVMRKGDSRAEPTGKGRFELRYGPKGVKFIR